MCIRDRPDGESVRASTPPAADAGTSGSREPENDREEEVASLAAPRPGKRTRFAIHEDEQEAASLWTMFDSGEGLSGNKLPSEVRFILVLYGTPTSTSARRELFVLIQTARRVKAVGEP